jgi:hypothetical protein
VSTVGAAQIFFVRFAALRPKQAKNGLAWSSLRAGLRRKERFLRESCML